MYVLHLWNHENPSHKVIQNLAIFDSWPTLNAIITCLNDFKVADEFTASDLAKLLKVTNKSIRTESNDGWYAISVEEIRKRNSATGEFISFSRNSNSYSSEGSLGGNHDMPSKVEGY